MTRELRPSMASKSRTRLDSAHHAAVGDEQRSAPARQRNAVVGFPVALSPQPTARFSQGRAATFLRRATPERLRSCLCLTDGTPAAFPGDGFVRVAQPRRSIRVSFGVCTGHDPLNL